LEYTGGPYGRKFHKSCMKCSACGKRPMDSSAWNDLDAEGLMRLYCRNCWDAKGKEEKKVSAESADFKRL